MNESPEIQKTELAKLAAAGVFDEADAYFDALEGIEPPAYSESAQPDSYTGDDSVIIPPRWRFRPFFDE